jgi:pimeloyl-ACP methyl ester carboxylesterase
MIAHAVIEGPESSRTAWILHGILGSGRNWRSFARALRRDDPTWRYVLPDLRNHGETGPLPGPHDLAACAADLAELPRPDRVIGHSFGGKVALQWMRAPTTDADVWVLDSIPVATSPSTDNQVMQVLAALQEVPVPAPERSDVREMLVGKGVPGTLVDWLLTSLRRGEAGWDWVYGLQGVEAMMASYFASDFGDLLAEHRGAPLHIVRAMDSDRWTDDVLARLSFGPDTRFVEFPDAGHWLHVDQPVALRRLLLAS